MPLAMGVAQRIAQNHALARMRLDGKGEGASEGNSFNALMASRWASSGSMSAAKGRA